MINNLALLLGIYSSISLNFLPHSRKIVRYRQIYNQLQGILFTSMSQTSFKQRKVEYALTENLALFGYSIVILLACLPLLLFWVIQFMRRQPAFDLHRLSRFSLYLASPVKTTELLIHCVSVGEVNVAANLVKVLRKTSPDISITVTTTTPTGAENAKRFLPDDVQHLYLPIDLGWMMSRLIQQVKPKQVLIVEVELWPNMIRQCQKAGIPVSLINGRMTDKSAKSYQKLSLLFAPMLRSLCQVCAQGQRDYENYTRLGMATDKLTYTGNIKFDLDIQVQAEAKLLGEMLTTLQRPIVIAGSTHEPEEQVILDTAKLLKNSYSNILWLIVPRHPQRFEKVNSLVSESGLKSTQVSISSQITPETDILLVDKMGVLSGLYPIADIAFVGGSIAQRGGHNALEPAAAGVPSIMGPSRYNNPTICEVLEESGSLKLASNSQELARQVSAWLDNKSDCRQAGESGAAVVQANQGATLKSLRTIELLK